MCIRDSPDTVNLAYGEKVITFGPEYIIPKPLDNRLISVVAPAVAKAAIESLEWLKRIFRILKNIPKN